MKRIARDMTMKRRLVLGLAVAVLLALVCGALIPVPKQTPDFSRAAGLSSLANKSANPAFRETRWYELVPKDWDPYKELRAMRQDLKSLPDGDVRATALLAKMRSAWDQAPTNAAMDGAAVRIPGYIVPVEQNKGYLKEFLLVPNFGACIHTPPPPANQIIHVVAPNPVKGFRSMDQVWVSGRLHVLRQDSAMGVSAFHMDASVIEVYVPRPRE
jgi:hypothetical protein